MEICDSATEVGFSFCIELGVHFKVPSAHEGEGGRRYRITVKAFFVCSVQCCQRIFRQETLKTTLKLKITFFSFLLSQVRIT